MQVGDFGLSCEVSTSRGCATSRVGTVPYWSPEMLAGYPITYSSDVYSAGCVLYEICMVWVGRSLIFGMSRFLPSLF